MLIKLTYRVGIPCLQKTSAPHRAGHRGCREVGSPDAEFHGLIPSKHSLRQYHTLGRGPYQDRDGLDREDGNGIGITGKENIAWALTLEGRRGVDAGVIGA